MKINLVNEYKDEKYIHLSDIKNLSKVMAKTAKEAKNFKRSSLTIILVDDKKMTEMNKEYRSFDKTTDVLTFRSDDEIIIEEDYMGEIYISLDRLEKQASELGHSNRRELDFLALHGMLHLLNIDHERSEEEEKYMFGLQNEIMKISKLTRGIK